MIPLYFLVLPLLVPLILWPIAARLEPCTCELYGHCARCSR